MFGRDISEYENARLLSQIVQLLHHKAMCRVTTSSLQLKESTLTWISLQDTISSFLLGFLALYHFIFAHRRLRVT